MTGLLLVLLLGLAAGLVTGLFWGREMERRAIARRLVAEARHEYDARSTIDRMYTAAERAITERLRQR